MTVTPNQFLQAVQSHDFFTENGALSHSTTGNALLDYFSKCGTYRGRTKDEVYADISRCWAESPQITLMIVFYLRVITRKASGFFDSNEVQKGQGNRDEFRKAVSWFAKYQPETFAKNLWLVPVVGRWSDLWHQDVVDDFDRQEVFKLVKLGLQDDFNRPLLAKLLPRIRSKSNTSNTRHLKLNSWAREFCAYMEWSERAYRKFKSDPNNSAHTFQRVMCSNLWDELDFKRIPGKALFNLTMQKGRDGVGALERHGQIDRYVEWLCSQPTVKFTGYPFELFNKVNAGISLAQKVTLDKQFDGLIELAKKDRGGITQNMWCALDTSASMTYGVTGNTTAFDICVALGIYFSALNEGAFKDNVIMFDDTSRVMQLKGEFTDKAMQIRKASTAWGSTNFQSVIDEIVRIRQTRPDVPVSDFPTTLLVVSDMQFNPSFNPSDGYHSGNAETNYETAMRKLAAVGLPKMQIVWWWVTGRREDFPSKATDKGVTMIGGFDGAILEVLLGAKAKKARENSENDDMPDAYEQMLTALDQEVLRQLTP